ncbi:MAG: hypothetical protein RLZZ600_806 [Actinomycetota bacterium]|jgi:LPXTG-motif cell wall-anchored protein
MVVRSHPNLKGFSVKRILVLSAAAALGASALVGVAAGSANATPSLDTEKVTICHRTHSVTNPYRMITVSKNSVNGPLNPHTGPGAASATVGDHAGYVHNKYAKTGSHARAYPSNPHVFDSTFAYSGPNKVWEDIIPPFTQTKGGGTAEYAGFNWSDEGKAIYFGTGDSAGVCRKMTAREYFDSEVDAGEDPKDVLADLREQDAKEDKGNKPTKESELPTETPAPNGPERPAGLTDPAQKILGKVWDDVDHDGTDDGETGHFGVTVYLKDKDGNVIDDTTTDVDGNFEFPSVDEGEYYVEYEIPASYDPTYDSTDASDGNTTAQVPVNGAGFSWMGLIPEGGGWTPPSFETTGGATDSSSSLPDTGASVSPLIPGAAALAIIGGALALFSVRRRRP